MNDLCAETAEVIVVGAETAGVIFVCIVEVSKLDQIFFPPHSDSLRNIFVRFVSTIRIFFLNVRNNMEEAIARNIVLKILHDRIPSYAMWDSNDIENESIDFRIKWWSELVSHQNITIVNMAKQWVTFLNTIRNQRFYK